MQFESSRRVAAGACAARKKRGANDQFWHICAVARKAEDPLLTVGWREWVVLPELSPEGIKAKIDTGARTGALHAFDIELFSREGRDFVRFGVHPIQGSSRSAAVVEQAVVGFRKVRSSTGHAEQRPVIRTPVEICGQRYQIDVTLTSRDEMGFRLLIGRAALRGRFVVDPGRSFVGSRKKGPRSAKTKGEGNSSVGKKS